MIVVQQTGDTYSIKFNYDSNLIQLVKNVPGRLWNPEAKIWTIPKNNLGMFLNQLKGTSYEYQLDIVSNEHINENASLDSTPSVMIPDIDISRMKFYVEDGHELYSHQKDFLKFAIDREKHRNFSGFICADEMGAGKALALDTDILTPTGYKPMSDIKIGDKVYDMYGNKQTVLRVYNHTSLNMYEITFSDGAKIQCCEDHLWTVCYDKRDYWETYTTKEIIDAEYVRNKSQVKSMPNTWRNVRIPIVNKIDFDKQDIPLDPWLMGYLIGNGSFDEDEYRCHVFVKIISPEIMDAINDKLPEGCMLKKKSIGINMYEIIPNTGNKKDPNPMVQIIQSLGLMHCTLHSKFIPNCYKYNSTIIRTQLLQGLMDAGGYVKTSNSHLFITSSYSLVKDTEFVAQSLGCITTEHKHRIKANNKEYGWNWHVLISPKKDTSILYKYCEEKKSKAKVRKFKTKRTIKSIKPIGQMPGKCITVSGETHTYVCKDFIVTHNTIEGFNLALYNQRTYGFKHCLIIACVNSAKYNWTSDIKKHTNGKIEGYILGSRIKKRTGMVDTNGGTKEKLEDLQTGHMYGDKSQPKLPYFIITNIESLRAAEGKTMVIYEELLKWIDDGKLQMIIIDEVHKNCSPTSTQGKMLLKLKTKAKKPVEYLPMTGTPITKRPTDLFLPLKLVNGHNYNSYYQWSQNFCIYGGYGDHDVIGYKNIPELKKLLQGNMIRRKRSEILDLPPKIQLTEYVDNTPLQTKLYNEVADGIIADREEILQSMNPLARFIRLRQVNGSPEIIDKSIEIDKDYAKKNAKMSRLLELLEEIHERNEKVVIFSNWVEPLRSIHTYLSNFTKYKCCVYTGTMSSDDREKHKKTFVENSNYTVMLGTIGALGVSHTLTVANNVIFIDEPWNPSDKSQAEDRCHRIGTTQSVNVYTIITRNTIDDRVHDILSTKQGISDYIVDNGLDLRKNAKLFDLLFADSLKKK